MDYNEIKKMIKGESVDCQDCCWRIRLLKIGVEDYNYLHTLEFKCEECGYKENVSVQNVHLRDIFGEIQSELVDDGFSCGCKLCTPIIVRSVKGNVVRYLETTFKCASCGKVLTKKSSQTSGHAKEQVIKNKNNPCKDDTGYVITDCPVEKPLKEEKKMDITTKTKQVLSKTAAKQKAAIVSAGYRLSGKNACNIIDDIVVPVLPESLREVYKQNPVIGKVILLNMLSELNRHTAKKDVVAVGIELALSEVYADVCVAFGADKMVASLISKLSGISGVGA